VIRSLPLSHLLVFPSTRAAPATVCSRPTVHCSVMTERIRGGLAPVVTQSES